MYNKVYRQKKRSQGIERKRNKKVYAGNMEKYEDYMKEKGNNCKARNEKENKTK